MTDSNAFNDLNATPNVGENPAGQAPKVAQHATDGAAVFPDDTPETLAAQAAFIKLGRDQLIAAGYAVSPGIPPIAIDGRRRCECKDGFKCSQAGKHPLH